MKSQLKYLVALIVLIAGLAPAFCMGSSEEFVDQSVELIGYLRQVGNAPFIETVFSAADSQSQRQIDYYLSPQDLKRLQAVSSDQIRINGLRSCQKSYYATKDGRYKLRYTLKIIAILANPKP